MKRSNVPAMVVPTLASAKASVAEVKSAMALTPGQVHVPIP